MGNETSSPERTKKNAVFESPVIIPHPDKELDDGGVYKGDHSDRILKVSEILRRSLEMDITENDESSSDVILRNVTENDGDVSEEPQSPTFRSSVTIHLTPCIKTLEPTDHESTSKENTKSIKTSGQPSPSVDRPVGENDQVIVENIDNTISNVCMSSAAAGPSLCNGDTSGMSENSSTGVTSELEDEIVIVTRVPYHRGNSSIDDYIEKAKKLALKSNECPAGAPNSEDNGVFCNGSDNVDNGVIDVIESKEVVSNHSEPVLNIEVIQKNINGELQEEKSKVPTEEQVQEVLPEKQPELTVDKEREPDNLETKVLTEIIQKVEIQRRTSSEEHKEKSKKKQSPLAKIGTKFNDALKTIKTKRRESMEKSKHRVSGAYAAEHDFTVKHASPTLEKSAIQWDDAERNKLNALQPNGISYEGATQKAYAICSEYACVVRKPGSSGMIELSPEIVEHKESESEYDTDSEIDTELIMKASAPQTEAERQGPLYVGLIVRDVKEDEKTKVCEENVEVCVQNAPNKSFDENIIDLVNCVIKDTGSPNETKPDIESRDTTVIQDAESEDTTVNRDVESVKTTVNPNEESENASGIPNEESENAAVIPNEESEIANVIPNEESEKGSGVPNDESENATVIPNEESENASVIPNEESVTTTFIPNVETENITVTQEEKAVLAEEETIKRLETEAKTEEKTTDSIQNTPSPTKVKKKNSILKYLLHRDNPKKGKKKDKSAKTPTSETKASSVQKENPGPESEDKQNVEATEHTLMYVECMEKEIVVAQTAIPGSEPKQQSESSGSYDAEFEEIDLASTSEQQQDIDCAIEQSEESLPTEDVESYIVPIKSERKVNTHLPDDFANDSMDLNVTGSSDNNELHTDENTDSAKSDFNDSGISDYHGAELQLAKQKDPQRSVEEKTAIDDVKNESSEKFDFDQNQAVVIDVTCADDTISESDMINDVQSRQEKRKLPDEENDSLELPSPSESPAGGASASMSAKSSPTRKKKKKRVNSLSAKISDFFGVAEFRRRISTSSNRSDKSPQDDRNVWSSEEKKSERKQSGSSIHEDMESRIQENEGTCSEIEEEITPKRSLEAKSMPMLNVEHSNEKHEEKRGSQTMHVKNRGKTKSKSPTKSSFLESFGLYTSKPKKRPVISSPIKQENRKSLFDEDIKIDVDQDLHIISLSDDEDENDPKSKSNEVKVVSKETSDDVIANESQNNVKEESSNSGRNENEKETEVEYVADKQTVLNAERILSNVETSQEDEKFVVSEISVDENNVIDGVSQLESKLSPGEYVSLKHSTENQASADEVTEYLKFEQDCVESSPNVESTEKGLNINQIKSQIDNDEENLSSCEKPAADIPTGTNSVENAVDGIRCKEDKILDKTVKEEEVKVENESKNVFTVNNDAAHESVTSNDGNETQEKISQEDVDSGKGDISESSEKKTDKNEHIIPTQNDELESESGNEASGCDSVGGSSEPPNRVIVVATIETLPVSKDTDLRDSVSPEMCQDTDGDTLCNNAEYDSIITGEERTVAIENPNYCSTCQVKNKSPSDPVDDLHSQAHIDVNGESTEDSKTITAESNEVRKSSSAAARSASMEELTVHSSHIYEEIEKKKPVIYRRFSDKSENRKVICTSPDPDGKKLKKKKSRSSSFSEFFRNPTKYKMPAWRNKKSKEVI